MDYLEIKKLEKYNPGYSDRNLIWCKVYFTLINADPEFELLCEIDKWRFIAFIMIQLQIKKPVPLDPIYLKRKGFDLKIRPIALTLKMLHNSITLRKQEDTQAYPRVEESRVEESRVDMSCGELSKEPLHKMVFSYFCEKTNRKLTLSNDRKKILQDRIKEGAELDDMKKAVDNFMRDDWPDRHRYLDIVYCFGIRNKINNFEKWRDKDVKSDNANIFRD